MQFPAGQPVNDFRDLVGVLEKAASKVIVGENLGLRVLHLALREIDGRLRRESLSLLFFAWHGAGAAVREMLRGGSRGSNSR